MILSIIILSVNLQKQKYGLIIPSERARKGKNREQGWRLGENRCVWYVSKQVDKGKGNYGTCFLL
jgi:hypothetical protein